VVRGGLPDAVTGFWDRHGALELVAAFVVWDAAGFAYHWVGHHTRVGWASHRVHHTGTEYDLTLAWRQSWIPLPALVVGPCVALVGFDLDAILICAAISKVWQALVHTSLPVRTPRWVAVACMTPDTHRRHHCVDGGGVNLGSVLTLWDRLAGTWSPEPVDATADYGIAGSPDRDSVVQLQMAGWRELALTRRRHGQPA
jgi:sterol desaturase/sphingolipid hydroxylase (fatty acid hydroxylase superfamily)